MKHLYKNICKRVSHNIRMTNLQNQHWLYCIIKYLFHFYILSIHFKQIINNKTKLYK